MNKKNIAILTLCTALSAVLTTLWAFEYIILNSVTAVCISVIAFAVLLVTTGLSIYATTGKSLGLVWALRTNGSTLIKSSLGTFAAALLYTMVPVYKFGQGVILFVTLQATAMLVLSLYRLAQDIFQSFKNN